MRLSFLIIFFYIGLLAAVAQDRIPEGGECEYKKYNCKIKITTIEKFLLSSSPDEPKYKVSFEVLPTKQLPKKIVYKTAGRKYIMLLNNMAYPGPLYLEKYHISPGKIFDCMRLFKPLSEYRATPTAQTLDSLGATH